MRLNQAYQSRSKLSSILVHDNTKNVMRIFKSTTAASLAEKQQCAQDTHQRALEMRVRLTSRDTSKRSNAAPKEGTHRRQQMHPQTNIHVKG